MDRFNRILIHQEFKKRINWIENFEKDRIFCHHGLQHLIDTARIGYILSLENDLKIPKDLIYATALLHDIGRYDEYKLGKSHTEVPESTIKILQDCGYSNGEINQIVEAIENHRKSPLDIKTLSDVLYKADKLSRMCFDCNAQNECYWSDNKKNHQIYI
ncbi:MAG: HD domain-containing protein [Oscillospiraceae bacterium]